MFRFVILACDGLFKVFSADEAVQFINNILQVCVYMHMVKQPYNTAIVKIGID